MTIMFVSIAAVVVSLGVGYLLQSVQADSQLQAPIQLTNYFALDNGNVMSSTMTKSHLAHDINIGTFDRTPLVRSDYIVNQWGERNIIQVQLPGQFQQLLDQKRPTVVSTVPLNRANNVLPSSSLYVTFSEEVRPADITTSTFVLQESDGTRVPGAVGIVRDHRAQTTSYGASFDPTILLQTGETYTASITSGIRDLAGNAMIPRTWSFTIGNAGTASPPVTVSPPPVQDQTGVVDRTAPKVSAVTPTDGANNVNPAAIIAARFSEQVQRGTVSSVTFRVTDSDGNPVQGAVIRPSSVSNAITTASFDPTSQLLMGETYTASITSGIRDLAGNAMIPRTWSFTIGDSTSPNTAGDTALPTVVATSPQDGSSGVPTYITIKAKFSEQVRKNTLSTSTFIVRDTSTGNAVPGVILLQSGPNVNITIFDPSSELVAGKKYSVEITDGVKDMAGNPLTPKKWSFTVGTTPGQTTADASSLRVLSVRPPDRTENVPSFTIIGAQFSKPIDPSTLSSSTFIVKDSRTGNIVTGTFLAQQATSLVNMALFDPASPLNGHTKYTVEITSGIKGTDGSLMTPKKWSFTTK